MPMTRDERLAAVHARAITRFDVIHCAVRDEREQCIQDRRFYSIAGAMWEDWLGDQFAESPKFEINKIAKAVIRIFSEYRNNRITVDFRPKDEDASSDTADTLDGLYRADEQEFTAQEAYDNAFEEAIGGGMGAWRLRAVLEDEYCDDPDDDRQRIAIEPIFDADTSVYFDLDAKRYDKADAKFAYVITSMTREAYDEAYPGQPTTSFDGVKLSTMFDWFTPDVVYVAEYFEVEEKTETIHIYGSTLPGQPEKKLTNADLQDADQLSVLKVTGYREMRQEKRRSRVIHKYVLNGAVTLEDSGRIAGKCIPLVPMYGKRWFVDNIERMQGEVRLSKDAQRLLNMQLSRLGEVAATTPFEVPILLPEQVAGHETSWANGNILRSPYRLINAIKNMVTGEKTPAGPVGQVKPPDVPPALGALLQLTNQAIDDMSGGSTQGQEMVANISGEAVQKIQNRLDMQNFIYMDNMAKSMRRCGQIWLSMSRDVLVQEGRKMQTVDVDGDSSNITLMQPTVDDDGKQTLANDVTKGLYSVYVDVGPSFTSRRESTVRSITGLMQGTQDPEMLSALSLTAIMNMDGEGLADIRDFARKKAVQLGVVKPTKDEEAEMQAAQQQQAPDPNTTFLVASAGKEEALSIKALADATNSQANASLTKAKELETLANASLLASQTHQTSTSTITDALGALVDANNALQGAQPAPVPQGLPA